MERLAVHGSRTALVHRGRSTSYAELRDAVHRAAHALRGAGLGRGDGIVLVAGNRPEAFTLRLSAFLLGLRFTPVVPGASGLRHILVDAQPKLVVVEAGADRPDGSSVTLEELTAPDAAAAEPLDVQARDEDVARVLFTSGTTGVPKGVPATYGALGAATAAWGDPEMVMPEGMRFVLATPFAHGSGDAAFTMLRFGATVEILDGFEPTQFVAAVDRSVSAVSYLYPSWLYQLLDHPGADLGKLAFLSYGSAPIAPARLRQAMERLGTGLMQTYATTEAPAIAMLDADDHAAAFAGRTELLASVGKPLPSTSVEIRAASGAALPAGAVGEVCVRSASMMSGYWNRPDLTAAALRAGWLHTGDLGRLDADGYLYLVGRLSDMIIVGGHNVYARPVEDVLAAHPVVREAAVVSSADAGAGEAVHAFVAGHGVSADELRSWAAERLEPAAVPSTITVLDRIPTTPLGKPDKAALRALLG